MKGKGLGRGLDALFDTAEKAPPPKPETLGTLKPSQLQPGKYQPRTQMDAASLAELADSIRAQGMIQPILVRPVAENKYEIIAGERRWRAAGLAGLDEVPVVIRDVPDQSALAMALIENIQRENLNPLEEALGMQRLIEEFQLTHQSLAESVGRSRTAVSNALRLLNLSSAVQKFLLEGKIDMGHARALLPLDPRRQLELAQKIVDNQLSVRETESLVNEILHPAAPIGPARKKRVPDRDVARLAEELSEQLGTNVEIKTGQKGAGKLILNYSSNEHLETLLARLK